MKVHHPMRVFAALVLASTIVACGSDDETSSSAAPSAVPDTTADTSEPVAESTDNSPAATESSSAETAPEASQPADERSFKVGVILSMTGPGTAIGTDFKTGLDAFSTTDPGASAMDIEYIVCDDQTTPDGAAACAQKLSTDDQVDMIYGPVLSGPHSGAAAILAGGPPSVTPSPYVVPEQGDPVYSVAGSSFDLDRTNLAFAEQRGYTTVGVIASTDLTGQTAVDNLERANEEFGLELPTERMDPTDVDASAQLNKLLESNPDAIYVAASGAATGVALKGLSQLGADLPVFLIWSNTTAGFLEAAAPVWPSEALYALSPSWLPEELDDAERAAQVTTFRDAFQAEAGAPPSFVVQGGYDAFQLIVEALTNSDGSKEGIVDYLDSLSDFQGLNWTLSYSPDNHVGSNTGNYTIMRYDAETQTWTLAE